MSKEINIKAQSMVECVFMVERVGPGDEVREAREFHNLILDSGLNELANKSMSGMMDTCHVGTGSSEPDQTDTSLEQELTSTDNTDQNNRGGQLSAPLHSWLRRRWVFPEGAAAGNLTEVGLSDGGAPTFLNRQLFRDENGDPITITILSDEILRVTAEGRVYSDIQDGESTTGSFQLNGQTINFTRVPVVDTGSTWDDSGENACDDNIGDTYCELNPDENGGEPNERTFDSYVQGSFERTFTHVYNAGKIDGPLNAIAYSGILLGFGNYENLYRFDIDNPPTIDETEELTLNFYRSWGRYTGTP